MFSEQDVDRELKAALSVSPSPDFAARVLQRVEADRPLRRTPRGWLAAAASLVLAAGAFYALNRTSPPAAPPQVVEQTAPRTAMPQPDAPVSTPATSEAARVAVVRTATRAPSRTEPEVIVPVNQMEAVRRLVRAVNEGRLEAPPEPPKGPMAPPANVNIAPVVVAPIPLSPLSPGREGK